MQMLQSDGVVSIHRLTWRSNCSLERGGNEIEKSEISSRLVLYVWCTPFVDGWYFIDYSHIHGRLHSLVGSLYPSHHHSCVRYGEQWPTSSMEYHQISCKFTSWFSNAFRIIILLHFLRIRTGDVNLQIIELQIQEFLKPFSILYNRSEYMRISYYHDIGLSSEFHFFQNNNLDHQMQH